MINNPKRKKNNYEISTLAIETANEKAPIAIEIFIFTCTAFLIAATIYASVTQVPVVVEAGGKLEPEVEPVPIKAQATFTVDKIFVEENKLVTKNSVLVTSADTLNPQDLQAVRNYLKSSQQISELNINQDCKNCLFSMKSVMADYLKLNPGPELLSYLQPINDTIRELTSALENYKTAESATADARQTMKLAKQKLKEIRKRKAEKLLAKETQEYQSQIVVSRARIVERYQSVATAISQYRNVLRARLAEARSRIDKFGRTFTVTAPFTGRVTGIKIKGHGELVGGGQVLMNLVPDNAKLRASLTIQNKDVAKIKADQKVILAVDAFPEMDYGSLGGNVLQILREDHEANPQMGAPPATYAAKIAIEKQSITSNNGTKESLIAGMTVTARIVVRFESMLHTLYRTLFKVKEDVAVAAK